MSDDNSRRFGRAPWVLAIVMLGLPAVLSAQVSTGTIMGRVIDPSGAAVAGANITVTEQNTGISVSTKTAASGSYSVPLLKPGLYTVTAKARGFQSAQRTNMTLQVQATLTADFQLTLGTVSQKVTVVGSGGPVIQTASAEVGNVISSQPVEQLPLNGRNFSELAYVAPGTNQGPYGGIRTSGNGNETQRAGAEIIANGARGSFNEYLVDGLDDRDESVGTIKVFPLVEDIQEFKVETGNYDAEFGAGGAVVNVITRSGTNKLHGSAFEFFRNSGLDSREYFDSSIPAFHQNQFGFSLGGPIRKNNTFFFGDYQGYYMNQATTEITSVPTALERTGNFSDIKNVIYDPTTFNPLTSSRTPFAGNIIPAGDISSEAQRLLALYPLPNLPGVANNFTSTPVEVLRQQQFDIRIDHYLSSRDSLFGRITDGTATVRWPDDPPRIGGNINPVGYINSLRNNNAPSTQATVQETHTFTPTLINQFAIGYTRFGLAVYPFDQGLNTAAGLGLAGADTSPTASSISNLSISGITEIEPANNIPEVVPQNEWQVNDTLAWVKGTHSMKFGVQIIRYNMGFFQLVTPSGGLSFSGVYTNNPASPGGTGYGAADFMLGLPVSGSKSAYNQGTPWEFNPQYGAFFQDQWRVRPKLTVNWGIRYDLLPPGVEKFNRQSDFDPATGGIALAGQNGISRGILDTQYTNFSPRIGLAYMLTPNTVIRAGYGLFYFNELGTGGSARLFFAPPFTSNNFADNCSATAPCLNLAAGIPSLTSSTTLPAPVYQTLANPTENVQQWNFTVQRQVSKNTMVQVGYVGNKGTNLELALNTDTATPGPGSVSAREPWPAYSSISAWEPMGNSSYNSLQVSVEHRLSHGFWVLGSYTWSRSLDEGGGGNSSNGDPRNNIQNPLDVAASYGLSDFNVPQRLTLDHLYELPLGKGERFFNHAGGAEQALLGGWDLRGILTVQNGPPFTLFTSTATSNTGTFQWPNRICNGSLSGSARSVHAWFNTACFVSPPSYQFGNAGRDYLQGPGIATYDFALDKEFRLTERFGLTFRTEYFNLLNHPNFNFPYNDTGVPSTGTITSVITNARQIQFALRLHF